MTSPTAPDFPDRRPPDQPAADPAAVDPTRRPDQAAADRAATDPTGPPGADPTATDLTPRPNVDPASGLDQAGADPTATDLTSRPNVDPASGLDQAGTGPAATGPAATGPAATGPAATGPGRAGADRNRQCSTDPAIEDAARPPDPDGGSGRRTFTPDFLTELFRNPLDPGYADAAARRARDGGPTGVRKGARTAVARVTMVGLGFLLVVAYQQTVAEEPARTQARAALVEQVQSRRAATENLQAQADDLGAEVAALREKELGGAAVAQLRDLESATGLSRVRGSGAKITLTDGPTPVNALTGERNTVGQVKDTDLQLATNALWSLGAEAIAVNGQRLTATSTIRQAGEAILVDFRPVGSPYQVVAIGPDDLASAFRNGYAGSFFTELASKYGMSFAATDVHDVTLDAANEVKLRVAHPVPSPTPKSSVSPSSSSKAAQPRGTPSEGGR